jgi:hypothetical protein
MLIGMTLVQFSSQLAVYSLHHVLCTMAGQPFITVLRRTPFSCYSARSWNLRKPAAFVSALYVVMHTFSNVGYHYILLFATPAFNVTFHAASFELWQAHGITLKLVKFLQLEEHPFLGITMLQPQYTMHLLLGGST